VNEAFFAELSEWLTQAGLSGVSETDIVAGFCDRCVAAGLPLARALLFIDTLHPVHEGRLFRWGYGPTESPVLDYGRLLYSAGLCLFLGRVYVDKDVQERIIRRSRLDWTIVRPTILTNGPRTRSYRVLVDPRDWTSGFISRVDVADFLVEQIDDTSLLRQTPTLTD
jgi:hypothetical protein